MFQSHAGSFTEGCKASQQQQQQQRQPPKATTSKTKSKQQQATTTHNHNNPQQSTTNNQQPINNRQPATDNDNNQNKSKKNEQSKKDKNNKKNTKHKKNKKNKENEKNKEIEKKQTNKSFKARECRSNSHKPTGSLVFIQPKQIEPAKGREIVKSLPPFEPLLGTPLPTLTYYSCCNFWLDKRRIARTFTHKSTKLLERNIQKPLDPLVGT